MEQSLDFSQLVTSVQNAGEAAQLNKFASQYIGDLYNLLPPPAPPRTSAQCILHVIVCTLDKLYRTKLFTLYHRRTGVQPCVNGDTSFQWEVL